MFSFYLALLIAAVFSAGMYVFMDPVLRLLGASRDTMGFARQYALCVLVAGGLPAVVSMTLANLLRSVGCSKQAGFGVSMGGLLNIALDPLFMFVLFPKGMEIVGAGTATALSNAVSCLYFLLVLRRMGGRTALNLSPRQGLPGKAEIASIFEVGVPSALAVFLFDLAYIVIDKLMTGYGDIPLAAVGIVLKAERLPLNVGIGLCQGMMPIAGYNYSAGNFKRMKEAVRVSRLAGLAAGAVSVILYQIFAGQIMGFFIAEEQTVALGTAFLRARCLATPFMFLSFHLVNLFQAVGKGGIALFLASVRWAVFNIPMLVIFNWLFGMYGIVWTQVAADILTVLVSFYVFYRFEERERAESFQARTAPSARH